MFALVHNSLPQSYCDVADKYPPVPVVVPVVVVVSVVVVPVVVLAASTARLLLLTHGATILLEANAVNTYLAVGQSVSGTGIQAGSTITEIKVNGLNATTAICKITLSLPVTGLTTS